MEMSHAEEDGSIPLERVQSLKQNHREVLRQQYWIQSVDQLYSLCCREEGREAVGEALDVDGDTVDSIVQEAESLLAEDRVAELNQGAPERPMGALLPDEEEEDSDDSEAQGERE